MDLSQKQFFQMQIQLLHEQLDSQKNREQKLTSSNQALSQSLITYFQVVEQRNQLLLNNEILQNNVNQLRTQLDKTNKYYDEQISKLKHQLNQKIIQLQKTRVDHQKNLLKLQQKNNILERIIENKSKKFSDLQKKVHQQEISMYKQSDVRTSRISNNTIGYGGHISHSNLTVGSNYNQMAGSTIRSSYVVDNSNNNNNNNNNNHNNNNNNNNNNSNNSNNNNENNMRVSNVSMRNSIAKTKKNPSYNKELMKMSKQQMKIMMKSLIKSKDQLDKGGSQLSMLSDISCCNTSKRTKTIMQ